MSITIEKINRRLYRLNYKNPNPVKDLSNIRLVDESKNLFFENNALEKIRNWEGLAEDTNVAYESALDAYDLMLQYGTSAGVKESTNILLEGLSKVRDANSLMRSLKYRFGRIRKASGITNVGKATVRNSIQQSINNLQNSLTAGQLMSKSSAPAPEDNTMAECYNFLISEASDINECDRIVRQYSNIHKRFNIDKLISESMQYDDSPYNLIFDIASYVDTFKSSFKSKYNSALESVWYGLNKYHIYCENADIINGVTDYFVLSRGVNESEIQDIKSIQFITPVFDRTDFSVLDYMDDDTVDTTIDRLDYISQAEEYGAEDFQSIHDKVKKLEESAIDTIAGINNEMTPEEQSKAADKMVKYLYDFRKQCLENKDSIMNLSSFKAMLDKIEQDNCIRLLCGSLSLFLSLIRTVFIIGSDVHDIKKSTELVDIIIKMIQSIDLSKLEAEKVLSELENEINTMKAKQTKIDDKEFNSRIEIYLDTLYANRAFIKGFIENNFEDPAECEHPTEDDEDDSGVKEAAEIILISKLVSSLCEDLIYPNIDMIINGNVVKLSNDTLDALTDFSITVPSIVDKDALCEAMEIHRNDMRKNASTVTEYIRIDCLNNNIQRLKNESTAYNTCSDARGCIAYLMCLNELKAFNANSDAKYFTEAMSFINTLKLAANNLRRAAIKLTDKEKAASNSIDMAVNQIARSMDKEMSAAERERIVRGQILPPASICLKYALAFGIAAIVKPELAVIAALGVFFTRKKSTVRERQMALDEIEIELKMCDRYIRIYEDQQDMQKLRQCEMIQRNLLRQQQRIRYKMKVDFKHADVSSVANVGGTNYRPSKD